jgi:hypothetical protein
VEGYPPQATAAAQLQDPASVLSAFRAVAQLRRQRPALQSRHHAGESYARVPTSDDANSFTYLRYHPDTGAASLIATNLLGVPRTYTLHFGRSRRVQALLGPRRRLARQVGDGDLQLDLGEAMQAAVTLPAFGYAIYDVG